MGNRVVTPKEGDWTGVKKAIQQLASQLAVTASPSFANFILTDITASTLIAADASKKFESVPGTSVHPKFDGITIKDSDDNIIFYADDDEMYFTASVAIPIATGHGMPWLFWFTYTV